MNRVKEMREVRGWSQERLAEAIGTSAQQVGRLESGKRRLSQRWLLAIAAALDCGVDKLLGLRADAAFATLIGAVAAGDRVEEQPGDGSREALPCPPGFTQPVAVVVRGTSMLPAYRDGDVLIVERGSGVPPTALGKDCIVETHNGSRYIKVVVAGTAPERYHLVSYNHPGVIADQRLAWAAPVQWIKRG